MLHACRPDGKSGTFCHRRGSVANRSTLGRHKLPGQCSPIPQLFRTEISGQKRDTSFRENLGTFQLRRDPAKVASRFVTVDFYFKLSSAPASWSRLSPLQPRPKKRERGLEGVGQGPCKPLVAFCRRGEWVALISPEGLFGELALSLISRLGPEFQTLFETLVL
jgi:hypothetical protein